MGGRESASWVSQAKQTEAPEKPDSSRARQPDFQRSKNRTGFRGVYPNGGSRFRAVIWDQGRLRHLGNFRSLKKASRAFALAAKRRRVVAELIYLARGRVDEEARRRLELAARIIALT